MITLYMAEAFKQGTNHYQEFIIDSLFKFLLFKSLSKYLVMLLKELGVWNFFETRAVQIRVVQELTL